MAEIVPKPIDNDLNLFKEEMLTYLKELEDKLMVQMMTKESNLKNDYEQFSLKVNSLMGNNKDMISDLVNQKLKLEKITELESFKNKVDGMLITHEVRIKNAVDEIQKIKIKYDKIVTDNLYVSGFIGNACQFRNLSEYLSYNISEVSKLKMEKEQYKKDIKDIKKQLDGTMKNMLTLNDNSVKLCNKYTDNKQEEFRRLLEVTQNELNQKSMEMRAMINQADKDWEEKANSLQNEFNRLLDLEGSFSTLSKKFEFFQENHEELKKNVIREHENLKNNENKLESAIEDVKKNDRGIKDLTSQIKNYFLMNNKLRDILDRMGAFSNKAEMNKIIPKNHNKRNSVNYGYTPSGSINLLSSPVQRRFQNSTVNLETLTVPANAPTSFKMNTLNNSNISNNNNDSNIKRTYSPKKRNTKTATELKNINDVEDDSESSSENNALKTEIMKQSERTVEKEQEVKENVKEEKTEIKKEEKEKENIVKESIAKEDLKQDFNNANIRRTLPNNNDKLLEKIGLNNKPQAKGLPLLTFDNRNPKGMEEIKKVSISLTNIGNYKNPNANKKMIDKKNMLVVINNNNKVKKYMKKKTGLFLDNSQQTCKYVNLQLPESPMLRPGVEINKKKSGMSERKGKFDGINGLINDYRAKIFYKGCFSDSKCNNITNELLDIPKKVTQAFGRTTYSLLFKKNEIDRSNTNNNINDFGYNGPKKKYKFMIKRNNSGKK